MKRIFVLALCLVPFAAQAAAAPQTANHTAKKAHAAKKAGKTSAAKTATAKAAKFSATQIVSKNVAARGGLKVWRTVSTLTLSGRLQAGGAENPELPFTMKMKRPHKSRLEIRFEDQTALQVYNGEQGWKVRPFLGRDEVEPYTTAEARDAEAWQELDGPLVDYAKKGTKVSLLGTEVVEGHNTYKLRLTLKSGDQRRVWIDTENFLERKIDGEPRKMDGKMRNVTIYYRDFKPERGLIVPHVFETFVEGGQQPHKLFIDQVAVNQPMDETLFTRPDLALVRASAQHAGHRP